MTENKRYRYYEHKGADYILDNPNTELDFIEMLGDCLEAEEIVDRLNEQDERIKELENKLNQTALEFLNHAIISMGKAVEISEMSYRDFIKYRAEQGNPMELQL